jgi:flagellar hook-associated protein 1 FlgK
MTSTFNGLNLSLRGLLAQQRSLDVTGHNIANADRVGYTRQEAVLAAAPSLLIPQGATTDGRGTNLGQGVEVHEYRRIRDDFLDLQWRAQNMTLGQQESTAQRLGQVEDILREPGAGGLGALLDKFWSSWQNLANFPENPAAKTAVLDSAATLSQAFNTLDTDLAAIATNTTSEFNQLVGASGPVQAIATELGQLNLGIIRATEARQTPLDLMDRRDQLLDELAKYGQVSVTPQAGNGMEIAFGDAAIPIVDDATVTWPQTITAATNGRLGALLNVANTTIPGYRTALSTVASQVVSAVNTAHGTNVFDPAGTSAATIALASPTPTIAAGTGGPGANDIALAIGRLRGGAPDTNYAGFLRQVGGDIASAVRNHDTAKAVIDTITQRRQSVAGVSMDEEMTNMIKFQRGYQAAARAMTTMDEAIDILINRTGRVGL